MVTPTTGYSGKTIGQKMGLDKLPMRLGVVRPPPEYQDLLADVWDALEIVNTGHAGALAPGTHDVVHMFTYDRSQLETDIACALAAAAAPKGAVWISWPKKSSKLFVDVTEDTLRDVILPLGWVDVKVAAVSEIWSGLKFLRRKT